MYKLFSKDQYFVETKADGETKYALLKEQSDQTGDQMKNQWKTKKQNEKPRVLHVFKNAAFKQRAGPKLRDFVEAKLLNSES